MNNALVPMARAILGPVPPNGPNEDEDIEDNNNPDNIPGLTRRRKAYIRKLGEMIFPRRRGKFSWEYVKRNLRSDHAAPEEGSMALTNPLRATSTFRKITPKNGSGTYSVLYGN